jgi:hypothetical protein
VKRQPLSLRPHDVCVLLQFAIRPVMTFRELGKLVGVSLGEAHNATKRLAIARLVSAGGGQVNEKASLEFLVYGVPYAFPGELGPETRGVPTAHSGPPLRDQLPGELVVWPSGIGEVRGLSLVPLCRGAPQTSVSNPELYDWLTVVDALRIGRARDRRLAHELLGDSLLNQRGRSL